MLERTDAITNEVLEPITFVLAHRIAFPWNGKEQSEDSAERDSNQTYTAAATLNRPTDCGYGVIVT